LQPEKLRDPEFLEALKAWKANLQVIVAFRMLPKVVWDLPEYGTFNLHASLLPNYRGAAPINWAIINGENETGVTTFFIDDKIDTGEIILQESSPILPEDNAGSLHDKLMVQGARLVVKTLGLITEGPVTTQPQPESAQKTAYKIHKDTCKIDWSLPGKKIQDHIRGLSPYPAAWTSFTNGAETSTVKLFDTRFEKASHELKVGFPILDKHSLRIAVSNGYLNILSLQLAGKRKMEIAAALNGLKWHDNAKFL
jgi:methionyl-tRNA formyltransferase